MLDSNVFISIISYFLFSLAKCLLHEEAGVDEDTLALTFRFFKAFLFNSASDSFTLPNNTSLSFSIDRSFFFKNLLDSALFLLEILLL